MECDINIYWDDETETWFASCPQMPIAELSLASGSLDALIMQVRYVVNNLYMADKISRVDALNFEIKHRIVIPNCVG